MVFIFLLFLSPSKEFITDKPWTRERYLETLSSSSSYPYLITTSSLSFSWAGNVSDSTLYPQQSLAHGD